MFTQEEYDRGDAVAFSWHINDVKFIDPSLTDEEAREILANFAKHHEGSQESMIVDLEFHVDNFKEKRDEKESR